MQSSTILGSPYRRASFNIDDYGRIFERLLKAFKTSQLIARNFI